MNLIFLKKRAAFILGLSLIFTAVLPGPVLLAEEEVSDNICIEEAAPVIAEEAEEPVDVTEYSENTIEEVEAEPEAGSDIVSGEYFIEEESEEAALLDSVSAESISRDSLSDNFTMPSAFLTKKKIVLNGMRRSVSDCTYLVVNTDGDYELSGLNNSGSVGISVNKVSYNSFPAFQISAIANSSTPRGSYKYDIVLQNKKNGARLKKVRLIVSVTKRNPAVKWQKNLCILNKSVKGDFVLNSPTVEGVSIVPLSGNEKYKPKIPKGFNITLQNEDTVKITATSDVKVNKSYPVTLWLVYADSATVKTVKRKFRVKVTDKTAAVKIKKLRGSSMDISDRSGTGFHYKPVIKNTGFVLNDIELRDKSISDNYYIEKIYDPDTNEITDFYVRAKDEAKLNPGKVTFNLNMILQAPRMDAKTVTTTASIKGPERSSKIKLTFVSGNNLKINETLSDNHVAGTIDLRVTAPKFAVIDTASIKDLTSDSGKVPQGAFKAYWTVDDFGQAARVRIEVDKSKITSGKKYTLIYSLKAKGAADGTAPTKVTVKFKA